jgi:lipopolysaccharide transport system ATP-binding protein
MNNYVIQVEKLSKQYMIGAAKQHYDTLRDQVTAGFKRLFRADGARFSGKSRNTVFWALKDISFEVKQGEVWGIIGRNGAGKSTLLKILSRITEPSRGRAKIIGRVGSLLEVGTGFHPELTGRENIYLNGAILGMKKAEIDSRFDDIVAFSEIGQFIDTPVKRFSSGMYLRLAFAVAAHLEPDVLIVDEVLAVGDAAFQKRCLGKMEGVAREGRTVLFVSHNMAAVENLCQKALLLDGGKAVFCGSSQEAIDFYLNRFAGNPCETQSHCIDLESAARLPKFRPILTSLEFCGESGEPLNNATLKVGSPLKLRLSFRLEHSVSSLVVTLIFENNLGQCVLDITSTPRVARAGIQTLVCDIPSLTLLPNRYKINVYLDIDGENVDRVTDHASITIIASDYFGNGKLPKYGFLALRHSWYPAGSESRKGEIANEGADLFPLKNGSTGGVS